MNERWSQVALGMEHGRKLTLVMCDESDGRQYAVVVRRVDNAERRRVLSYATCNTAFVYPIAGSKP